MPQSFNILRCYNCDTFQVQIVKKTKKWECKICGEKQSIIKSYGEGTGKECRLHVQKLNHLRAHLDNEKSTTEIDELQQTSMIVLPTVPNKSKWNQYVEQHSEVEKFNEDSGVGGNENITSKCKSPKKKTKIKSSKQCHEISTVTRNEENMDINLSSMSNTQRNFKRSSFCTSSVKVNDETRSNVVGSNDSILSTALKQSKWSKYLEDENTSDSHNAYGGAMDEDHTTTPRSGNSPSSKDTVEKMFALSNDSDLDDIFEL